MIRKVVAASLLSLGIAAAGLGQNRGSAPEGESKPTPRLPNGKVDFGGKGVWAPIWVLDWADKKYVEHAVDVPFTELGLKLYKERRANESKDDPEG